MSKPQQGIAGRVLLGALLLVCSSASGAAWPAGDGELIINQTTLADFYSFYARNSSNLKLLELPGGSVVQAGDVRRFGFLLGFEYGLTERLSATVNLAVFYTQHVNVGENLKLFTNSKVNTQVGLQDFTGNVRYTLVQLNGAVQFALAPNLGWAVPLTNYDTSVDNPLGDGVVSIEPGLAASLIVSRFFVNGDLVYKLRPGRSARVGATFTGDMRRANPALPVLPCSPGSDCTGTIHDQVQATLEAGFFITDWLSIRAVVRRIETLGGTNLSFEGMSEVMMAGLPRMSMFDNSLAYDQDALYVGGGPYVQVNQYFGIGATYVHALWFRNFPNMKTVVLSLSFNPQFAARKRTAQALAIEAEQIAEEAAPEEAPDAAKPVSAVVNESPAGPVKDDASPGPGTSDVPATLAPCKCSRPPAPQCPVKPASPQGAK